ncbi:MAG: maleylpyruvate isomerase family mycothiol-dependent enzyme [Actinomycetota bacterium]|nr:maleylpyruvate isomerase family mycothiol-dependent enzyme [Actinomycetota bacterium]
MTADSCTALTPQRYLALLREDVDRLAELARDDLAAPVPPCPGWTLGDVLAHTAEVYLHKVEAMRIGARPDPWPPADIADREPRALFTEASTALLHELETRDPDAPTWTWHAADQRVRFWHRRMAQETAVHRVDAELATGQAAPIDADLATDGVDEVLRLMLDGPWWASYETSAPVDARVRVESAGRAWTATCSAREVDISAGDDGPVAATVRGEPHHVLLWLWGRVGDHAVRLDGDAEAVAAFRRRLVEATQ